jgi:Tfp pilus assembly protein PilN
MVKRGGIKKWAVVPLPQDTVKSGTVRDPQLMSVILDKLFRSLKLDREFVMCSVTGMPFIYRTIRMPGKQRIAGEAVEREARREMSLEGRDIRLSWQATEFHDKEQEIDYFVMGIPGSAFNPLQEAFSRAKIKPQMIDVKPLALARSVGLKETLIVSVEDDSIDVVVVSGGLVRVIHSYTSNAEPLDTIGRVNEIADGLNKAVKSFNRDYPHLTLSKEITVLLAGKQSAEERWPLLIQRATGYPVQVISSPLQVPPGLAVGLYASALGLAYKKINNRRRSLSYKDINLNLATGVNRPHMRKFQTAYILAAVLTLALAVLVFKTYEMKSAAAQNLSELKQQADLVTRELNQFKVDNQKVLTQKQEITSQFQSASLSLETIKRQNSAIISQRIDHSAQISAIYNAVPEGVGIDKIEVHSTRIDITGTVEDAFNVLAFTSNLEKVSGFYNTRVEQLTAVNLDTLQFKIFITTNQVVVPVITTDLKVGDIK